MFKKSILLTAVCISSMSLSGCSSIQNGFNIFAEDVVELVSLSWIRGSSTKSDINFAENIDPVSGTYKTEVGEYVPTTTEFTDVEFTDVTFNDQVNTVVDTSPHPCPDGTYMAADNTCASLENETFDFADITSDTVNLPVDTSPHDCPEDTYMAEDNTCMFFDNDATDFAREFADQDVNVVVDTSQHTCPEGTYLNAENACMYLETETFDFAEDLSVNASMAVDTSPVPCPDGTYLNAENTCMYLENETTDFASDTLPDFSQPDFSITPSPELTGNMPADYSVMPSTDSVRLPVTECPEGFKSDGKNSCMYLGASLQTKF